MGIALTFKPFQVQATTPKTSADVAKITYEIFETSNTAVILKTHTATNTPTFGAKFTNVPPGTYKVKATVFDGSNKNIIQGGGSVVSTNTATVANGASVLYSTGTALNIPVQLLNGVGDDVNVNVALTNGSPIPPIGGQDVP